MKKILYIVLYAISGIVAITIVGYGALSYVMRNASPITKTETIKMGPYACANDLSLSIEQQFSVNSLEGAGSRLSTKVSYGSTTFSAINQFQKQVEQSTGKTFKFDEYTDYLNATQKSRNLPSQEELMARHVQPTEEGFISIGTIDAMTEETLNQFTACFVEQKKHIYDDIVAKTNRMEYIRHIWFVKAYAIVLSK